MGLAIELGVPLAEEITEGSAQCLTFWGIKMDSFGVEDILESFNGASFLRDDLLLEAEVQVHSDTTGSVGFGV